MGDTALRRRAPGQDRIQRRANHHCVRLTAILARTSNSLSFSHAVVVSQCKEVDCTAHQHTTPSAPCRLLPMRRGSKTSRRPRRLSISMSSDPHLIRDPHPSLSRSIPRPRWSREPGAGPQRRLRQPLPGHILTTCSRRGAAPSTQRCAAASHARTQSSTTRCSLRIALISTKSRVQSRV